MKLKSFKIIVSYILPIFLFILFFYYVDINQIFNMLKKINIFWFLVVCLSFGLMIFLTAVRAKYIIGRSSNIFCYFFSNSISSLLRNILPSRSGEISFPIIWKRYCNVPLSRGTATLITTRVYDFLISMLIFLISFILLRHSMPEVFKKFWFILLIALIFILLLTILILPQTKIWKHKIRKNIKLVSSEENKFWNKIIRWLYSLLENFEKINSQKIHIFVFFVSCIIVFFRLFFIYSSIRTFGFILSIEEIILMSFFLFWTKMVQTVGNLGTQEAGIAGALIVFGVAKDEAIALAISTHILQLIPIVMLAFISYIVLILLYTKGKKV